MQPQQLFLALRICNDVFNRYCHFCKLACIGNFILVFTVLKKVAMLVKCIVSLSTLVLNSRDWSEIVWFPEISRFKINLTIGFIRKNPTGMHWLGYNDTVSWLNEAKTRIFQPTANFEIFENYLYFVCLPAYQPSVRPGCARCSQMIKIIAADLRKCCSEDDLPTALWQFLLSFSPSLYFFIPLARCESHLRRCR